MRTGRFNLRYFRREWREGPLFVSPTFEALPAPSSTPRRVAAAALGRGCEEAVDMETAADPREVGMSASRLQKITRWMHGWVDSGKLPGMTVAIARQGKLAYMQTCGCKDAEEGADISPSTIFRIYSMTKPIVSAAAMILYEEGKFQLDGPIAEHLPEFKEPRVFVSGGTDGDPLVTEPATRGITFRDLLTHTSGLSYGDSDSVVDKLYRQELGQASWEDSIRMRLNLKEFVERIARAPLLFNPGTSWRYSYSTDVLGRLLGELTAQPLANCVPRGTWLCVVHTGGWGCLQSCCRGSHWTASCRSGCASRCAWSTRASPCRRSR